MAELSSNCDLARREQEDNKGFTILKVGEMDAQM